MRQKLILQYLLLIINMGIVLVSSTHIYLTLVNMRLNLLWSSLLSAIVAIAVIFLPAPALAALTPINADAQNGQLTVLATESKDLPGFTNTLSYPVKVKISAEGQWRAAKPGEANSDLVDADAGNNVPYSAWLYPDLKLGTLVGQITDAKGAKKFIKSGKNQEFELQPGDSVSFIFNDGLPYFADNSGSQIIKFSSVANKPNPQPLACAASSATPISINADTQNGQLTVLANESKNLPSFSNTLSYPVQVKINAEGQWRVAPANSPSPYDKSFDADGSVIAGTGARYPEIRLGTLVGEIKDANGVRKFIKTGKNQEFELQPGDSVSFILNDGKFDDNSGCQTIKFSTVANKPAPVPPAPKPIACIGTSSAKFLVNIPYRSFAGDSPFKDLKTNSDWFYLEDFKDANFALNTPGVIASSPNETGKYTDSTYFDVVDEDDGPIDGRGRAPDRLVLSKGDITFTFDKSLGDYPTDAAIVWTDIDASDPSFGSGRLTFEAFDANGKSLGAQGPFVIGGDYSTMSETPEDRFFGVHYNGGISAIKVFVPVVRMGVEFDHLQYGHKCQA